MGKHGTLFSALKKALNFSVSKDSAEQEEKDPNSKRPFVTHASKATTDKRQKKTFKEKNRWSFRRSSRNLQVTDQLRLYPGNNADQYEDLQNGHRQTGDAYCLSRDRLPEQGPARHQNPNKQAIAVAVATAAAAEAAIAAAQAAAQVVKLTGASRSGCNSNIAPPPASMITRQSQQELAAIRIQTAFRAYLARRTFRTLKGLARLQALAQGRMGHKQATATMRCMQALVRAQAAVRGRRTTRLCDTGTLGPPVPSHPTWFTSWEQNESCRRENIHADVKEEGFPKQDVCKLPPGPEWDYSTQTIEQAHARELDRQEAAVKRERAMAYAFAHQQLHASTNSSGDASTPPQLGWNWLERWMAAKPWENRRSSPAKESRTHGCNRPLTPISTIPPRPASPMRRVSAPTTPAPSSRRPSAFSRTASPARSIAVVTPTIGSFSAPATRIGGNFFSMSSRGHSLASSSMRDDVSVASYVGTPSYMASTESARAKLRSHSTPKQRGGRTRSAGTSVQSDDIGARQQQHPFSRKRLSFTSRDSSSARTFLSWRAPSSLQRNHSFETYNTKPNF